MTQRELAVAANTSETLVSHVEIGRRQPQLETLRRLAAGLGVTVGQLVDDEPATPQ